MMWISSNWSIRSENVKISQRLRGKEAVPLLLRLEMRLYAKGLRGGNGWGAL